MTHRALRLLHLTDPHLHAARDSRMRGVQTDATLRAVIDMAFADPDPPEAVLATGDLVQDETRAGYERLRELLGGHGVPVYCLAGNHDAPALMAEVLGQPPFQCNGHSDHGNWRLVMLSTHSPGDDGGRLAPADLERLAAALGAPGYAHALVCLHHHPVPMGSRWLDGVALRNGADFLEVLDRFDTIRAVVWGHVHQASERRRHGVRLLSTPATCAQFVPLSDDFALDARPPGFRWLDLQADGTIDTAVVWLES